MQTTLQTYTAHYTTQEYNFKHTKYFIFTAHADYFTDMYNVYKS